MSKVGIYYREYDPGGNWSSRKLVSLLKDEEECRCYMLGAVKRFKDRVYGRDTFSEDVFDWFMTVKYKNGRIGKWFVGEDDCTCCEDIK